MTKTTKQHVISYSPRPRSTYRWEANGHSYGPATSSLLDTQEIWNLAYLSHDYESRKDHKDPQYTSNVRRTSQTKLDGSGLDMVGSSGSPTVAKMLSMPAPQFVLRIKSHPVLELLPMFKAYGAEWLRTIEERSWLCKVDSYEMPELTSVREASDYLRSLRSK